MPYDSLVFRSNVKKIPLFSTKLTTFSLLWRFVRLCIGIVNVTYRRAILHALEELHDYQTRSNIDAVRRHTQDKLESESDRHIWNEVLFLKTLKAIIRDGEIEQCTNVSAALSPEYKKKRAEDLRERLEERKESAMKLLVPFLSKKIKEAPKRRSEHEKWKIMPKKVYDKTM
jgi:hypothetical protein